LKLENVLLTTDEKGEVCIKLIDFGTSDYFTSGEKMTNFAGSLYYAAPEVICQSYTEKCDIWSIGVITYSLLFGKMPFDHPNEDNLKKKILQTKLKFSPLEKY
jgi:serine/threonine protein kinase